MKDKKSALDVSKTQRFDAARNAWLTWLNLAALVGSVTDIRELPEVTKCSAAGLHLTFSIKLDALVVLSVIQHSTRSA